MKKNESVIKNEEMLEVTENEFFTDEELDSMETRQEDAADRDETIHNEGLENSFGIFLNEISQVPLLTANEEIELAKRAENGDISARNRLVESNIRLVVSIAKRYAGRGVSLPDLVQEGTLGLMKGVEKFDWRLNYRLSTYVTWWIRQSIARAISDYSRTIRYPAHMGDLVKKVNYKKNELTAQLGHEPSNAEFISWVSKEMDITEHEVTDLLTLPSVGSMSLDSPIGEDEDTVFGDLVADEDTPLIEDRIIRLEAADDARKLLTVLSDREREIMAWRWGLGGSDAHTLEETGNEFGVSRERIRQIETVAIRKMRKAATPDMAS